MINHAKETITLKRTYVPPSGNPNATLAICGEQPGIQEVRGQPPRPFIENEKTAHITKKKIGIPNHL